MPESVRLSVARNRHPSDHSFRLEREQLEAHLGVEGAGQLGVCGGDVLPVMDRSHGLRLAASVGNRAPDEWRSDEGTCLWFAKSDDDVGSPARDARAAQTG
jgi:hypothetical protein